MGETGFNSPETETNAAAAAPISNMVFFIVFPLKSQSPASLPHSLTVGKPFLRLNPKRVVCHSDT